MQYRPNRKNCGRSNLQKCEIQGGKGELHYNISIKPIPEYQVLSPRRVVPDYYSEGDLWKELSFLRERKK